MTFPKRMSHFTKIQGSLLVAVGILVGITLVTIVKAQSAMIQACVSHSGGIRIVSSQSDCHRNETYLSWNIQGLQGPPGPSGAPGPSGPPGPSGTPGTGVSFNVLDSGNQVVGLLIGVGEAVRQIGSNWVLLNVSEQGFNQIQIFYEYTSSDCSGTPYTHDQAMFRSGAVRGDQIYYAGDPMQTRTLLSFREFTPPDTFGACQPDGVTIFAGPIVSATIPTFVPPFHISQQ